jgi:cobalt-zinc-cadmium efflux system outer membrane protein
MCLSLLQEVKLKTTLFGCGLLACVLLLGPAATKGQAQGLVLDSLIAEALSANPDLAAAKLRYQAFQARVPQAGSLPDPMLKATASNLPVDSWDLNRTPMSGIEFMLTQTVPFPGKLGLKKSTARDLARKAESDYETAADFVVAQLKADYYRLYLLDESIDITRENKSLLQEFAQVASTRYSVGKGLQQDVLKAQVEVSKMTDQLVWLEEGRRTARAEINVLLNRSPQDSLGRPEKLEFREMAYSETQLQNMATDSNPALQGMESTVRAAQSSHRLARREYLPDFAFSVGYRVREEVPGDPVRGVDFFSASVGVNVPLYFWSKQKKKVEEKESELKSARFKYEQMGNQVKLAVSQLFYSLARYKEQVQLYGSAILPQARASLESARSGYQVDKVDFLTLLNSQTTLYNYQIAYHQALSSYFSTVARLEEMVGRSLLEEGE